MGERHRTSPRRAFLGPGTAGTGRWLSLGVLGVGGCAVHGGTFSGVPGLYLLDTRSSILPTLSTLRQPKMSPDAAQCPQRATWSAVPQRRARH